MQGSNLRKALSILSTTTAKYPGYCKACGEYHIKAGQNIVLKPYGWADPACAASLNRVQATATRNQHNADQTEADRLGIHLYEYYKIKRQEERQNKKRTAKEFREAVQHTGPAPEGAPRRRTPCDTIDEEIARFRANPVTHDWVGIEVFY